MCAGKILEYFFENYFSEIGSSYSSGTYEIFTRTIEADILKYFFEIYFSEIGSSYSSGTYEIFMRTIEADISGGHCSAKNKIALIFYQI